MKNNEVYKKKIIYRSMHRGSREMDLLLGNFVKKYIYEFNNNELQDLDELLSKEDEILYKWYFKNIHSKYIQDNKVSRMLKNFKI